MLAHNGEINTLKGNINWMKSHEIRMATPVYGDYMADIKPMMQPGGSDSAALDNVFEVLVRRRPHAPMVKTMLIPEAWAERETMPRAAPGPLHLLQLGDGAVGRAGRDLRRSMAAGCWPAWTATVCGRCAMRSPTTACWSPVRKPAWCASTKQNVVAKGRVGPGQMIAVDLARRPPLQAPRDHGSTLRRRSPSATGSKNITVIDTLVRAKPGQPASFEKEELRRRQLAAGFSHGGPGADPPSDGRGGEGSRRLDGRRRAARRAVRAVSRPLSTTSARTSARSPTRRSTPCAKRRVMTLKTRFGNLGNILDQDESQCRLLQLETPDPADRRSSRRMRAYMGASAAEIDCTFEIPKPGAKAGRQRAARRHRPRARARRRTPCAAAPCMSS